MKESWNWEPDQSNDYVCYHMGYRTYYRFNYSTAKYDWGIEKDGNCIKKGTADDYVDAMCRIMDVFSVFN